jgi:hypothetical protein
MKEKDQKLMMSEEIATPNHSEGTCESAGLSL